MVTLGEDQPPQETVSVKLNQLGSCPEPGQMASVEAAEDTDRRHHDFWDSVLEKFSYGWRETEPEGLQRDTVMSASLVYTQPLMSGSLVQ